MVVKRQRSIAKILGCNDRVARDFEEFYIAIASTLLVKQ